MRLTKGFKADWPHGARFAFAWYLFREVSASGQHGHVTSGMATPSVAGPNAPLRAIQLIYDRISEPRAISLHSKEVYVGCVCDGTLWQQWRREKRRGAFGGGVVLRVRHSGRRLSALVMVMVMVLNSAYTGPLPRYL